MTCLRSAETPREFGAGALSHAVNRAEGSGSCASCGNLADTNSLLSEEEDVVFGRGLKNRQMKADSQILSRQLEVFMGRYVQLR